MVVTVPVMAACALNIDPRARPRLHISRIAAFIDLVWIKFRDIFSLLKARRAIRPGDFGWLLILPVLRRFGAPYRIVVHRGMLRHLRVQELGPIRLIIFVLNNRRRDEDENIALLALDRFAAEGPTEHRDVAEERHFGEAL